MLGHVNFTFVCNICIVSWCYCHGYQIIKVELTGCIACYGKGCNKHLYRSTISSLKTLLSRSIPKCQILSSVTSYVLTYFFQRFYKFHLYTCYLLKNIIKAQASLHYHLKRESVFKKTAKNCGRRLKKNDFIARKYMTLWV